MHGYVMMAALVLYVLVGPMLLAWRGARQARLERSPAHVAPPPWRWSLTVRSTLLYTLAYNLTFFIQELFLVVPKALTPGLRPTLFHNNHTWEGDHPLASLFQGTGALAILASGIVCLVLLRGDRVRATTLRLFVIWMAFHGFFQALPQVVMGALIPG